MELSFLTTVMQDQLIWLSISGVAGAYVRGVFWPEPVWSKRVQQGVVGAMSAIFAGGFFAHFLDGLSGTGLWAYMLSGFIMGSGGEASVKALQDFGLSWLKGRIKNGHSSSSK